MTVTLHATAMSYQQARERALFLTDKMAYELNLTDEQYEAAYEINLDYLMSVNGYDDVYGDFWRQRNLDLSYILYDWQYRDYLAASYFYRPVVWSAGAWHFTIYSRYPTRTHFFFSRPQVYITYRGGHGWRYNGGRSWYLDHRPRPVYRDNYIGMRDRIVYRGNNRTWDYDRQQNRRWNNGRHENRSWGNNNRYDNNNRRQPDNYNRNRRSWGDERRSSTRSTIDYNGVRRNWGNGENSRPQPTFSPGSTGKRSFVGPNELRLQMNGNRDNNNRGGQFNRPQNDRSNKPSGHFGSRR